MKIDKLIVDLSSDPFNPDKNFAAALEYDKLNQTASAVSFYLRSAEYGYKTHKLITYTSLLKTALCFERQKDRQATVLNNALQAMTYMPERPEAYFIIARTYERGQQWRLCYSFAELGLKANHDLEPLPSHVEYYEKYCLTFEKAVSSWWLGLRDESRQLLLRLQDMNIAPEYAYAVKNNLERVGFAKKDDVNSLEPVVTLYRKFFGKTADVIFDIGTRDGDDADYLSKKLNGTSVYAIDANPKAIDTVQERYPWMSIMYTAISDFNGETRFQQVISDNVSMAGCSSIYANKVANEPQFNGKIGRAHV